MNKTTLAAVLATSACLCSCGVGKFFEPGGGHVDSALHGTSALIDLTSSVGAQGSKIVLTDGGAGSQLITAVELSSASAIYGELRYDPAALHVTGIRPAASGPDALVLIADDPAAGRVQFGWVLPNFDLRTGVTGNLEIGSVAFAEGAAGQKAVLRAPTGTGNAVDLTAEIIDPDNDKRARLTWLEGLQGDGDNNGDVNISDLTPLGISFGATPGSGPGDSQARDADYDKNGEVNISDITPLGLNLGTNLGGYKIMAGPAADNLSEYDDFARSEMFTSPLNAASGECAWVWEDSTDLLEDTHFQVVPYDAISPDNQGLESDTEFLEAPAQEQTVSDITIELAPGVTLDQDGGGDYIVILTENSVDATPGNAEPLDGVLESLQLAAMVDTVEEPGNIFNGTSLVVWRLVDGGGLATVGNGGAIQKGLLSFVNRGRIEIEAHAVGNFAVKDTLGFKLYSIQEIQLGASPGGAGPVSVASGASVAFTATGIFDFDGSANGNEVSADISPFVGWGMIPDGTNTGAFSFNTGGPSLSTDDAASGDGVRVSAEFPRNDNITLYDNQKKGSNLVRVDIS